jgi:hypothetical protein
MVPKSFLRRWIRITGNRKTILETNTGELKFDKDEWLNGEPGKRNSAKGGATVYLKHRA